MAYRSLSGVNTIASQVTLLAQRRHHTRVPNKRLGQRGLVIPGCSRAACTNPFDFV